jgi:CheY-like chemotaxis protein
MRGNPMVLLVQSDAVERELLGTWFEMSGFDVTACPGPSAPTYVCIGDRTGRCPLIDEADVVVLDCRIDSDDVLEGTAAYDLLSLYVSSEKPVVVLDEPEIADLFAEDEVVFVDRGLQGGVVGAVQRLVSEH